MATYTSGIGSGWSLAKEGTYGTATTPTVAHPLISETLSLTISRADSPTLKGGNLLVPKTSWRSSTQIGQGSVQTLMYDDGSALLTEAMLGSIATTGSDPYVHTATLAQALPSYSMQVSFGGSSGVMVKKIEGAVCTGWELAAALGANLTLGLDWVYEDETVTPAGGAGDDLDGTYPTGQTAYNAADIALTIGGTSYCVNGITLSGANNLKTDGWCLGTTLIRKPTRNGFAAISGTLELPLDTASTTLYDIYTAATLPALVMTATQGSNSFVVNAVVRLDGTTPQVSGPEEQTVSIPFTVSPDDGDTDADAFSIVTTNGDSTP